jgi:FMN phosphatase YigB (HAD superfamily)
MRFREKRRTLPGRTIAMPEFHTDPATVPISLTRPLLIIDADEVLLLFADGFDKFLAPHGYYLDFSSYRLFGNVRRKDDNAALSDEQVTKLLDEFREIFDSLAPVEGALEALAELAPHLEIVVLSNMTPSQAPPRLRNFAAHSLALPLVINSGPKGPAVHALAGRAGNPVFFVDDIPQHLASAAELAPDVVRIHLIGDRRLRPLQPISPHAHFRADTWDNAADFIRGHLARKSE